MPSPLTSLRAAGLAVERSVKQHRWLWRYKHCRRVLQAWVDKTDHRTPNHSRSCLLDLRRIAVDGEQGRRFHALVTLLGRGGYDLSMVPRLQFMQTGHREFKANALAKIKPFFADKPGDEFRPFDVCLTDGTAPSPFARRTIPVLTGTGQAMTDGDLALPYSFFPSVWDQREDDRFEHYRNGRRNWRLFFGGHCSIEAYRGIRKYKRLRPVDRYRVVREVQDYFAGSTLTITSDAQLESALGQRHESFVMINNAHYRTDPSRWLGLLAESDFFLAAPGGDYPFSHNVIEAIAVGTIPVLEYDSLFTPPLCDGENCLVYRGIDGLRHAAARIETMDQSDIMRLRAGAIDYYKSHLSPQAFCKQLESNCTQRLHLFSYLTPAKKSFAA